MQNNAAVLFDMDGTLIDSSKKLQSDVSLAFELLGEKYDSEECRQAGGDWVKYLIDKKTQRMIAEHERELTGEEKEKLTADFWNAFNERPTWTQSIKEGVVKIFSETLEVLDQLKKEGYKLILVSRSEEKETMEKVNGFGLGAYFSKPYLVPPKKSRAQRSRTKTLGYMQAVDREGLSAEFLLAAQQLEVPARLFVVGDREEDVFAGAALKRWASRDNKYQNLEVVSILVDRKGKEKSRFANAVVPNLNVALEVIQNYD